MHMILFLLPPNIDYFLTMRSKQAPVAPESPDGNGLTSNLFNKDGTSKWSLRQAKNELRRHHTPQKQTVTSQVVKGQSVAATSQNNTIVLGTPEPS